MNKTRATSKSRKTPWIGSLIAPADRATAAAIN
jgi:hypothetical protein